MCDAPDGQSADRDCLIWARKKEGVDPVGASGRGPVELPGFQTGGRCVDRVAVGVKPGPEGVETLRLFRWQ